MGWSPTCVSVIEWWKTNSIVYSAGGGNRNSARLGQLSKKPAKESSQLIEIVGTS
jgi:hypothetical protein